MKLRIALPEFTATVGARALLWISTAVAIAALVVSLISINASASTADSMPVAPQAFSTGVVPAVLPKVDHSLGWAFGETPEHQSTYLFGSRSNAIKAQVVYDSAALAPADKAEADASQVAWKACLPSKTGDFAVSHSFQLYIQPGDCRAWFNGTVRGQSLEELFSNW